MRARAASVVERLVQSHITRQGRGQCFISCASSVYTRCRTFSSGVLRRVVGQEATASVIKRGKERQQDRSAKSLLVLRLIHATSVECIDCLTRWSRLRNAASLCDRSILCTCLQIWLDDSLPGSSRLHRFPSLSPVPLRYPHAKAERHTDRRSVFTAAIQ